MNNAKVKKDFSAAFAALRLRFEQGLPARIEHMSQLVKQADAASLADVESEAHKLAGACGTFGHVALGSLARQIEQLVNVVKAKQGIEFSQAMPVLQRVILEFEIAVEQALKHRADAVVSGEQDKINKRGIWLLLQPESLMTELKGQLGAFGHEVVCFSDFETVLKRLQTDIPALMFSSISLPDQQSLFEQKLILNLLAKYHSRLLVFSEKDTFDLRIKAAQLRADAFFVSQLDIPNMIATISDLLEHGSRQSGRVFIVDDDLLLAQHYALVLNAIGVETKIIENIQNIVNELMRFQPDLILMDMYMPDYSGAELAGVIRQYQSLKQLPIVFLSSEDNKALQMRAMAHGADDFLTKPIGDVQLAQSIQIRLSRSLQIKNLIEKDGLTALAKHSAIKETAELEFGRSLRQQKPLSLVMVDIDHFKLVNDNYGHATGDVVITALATLLRKRIRRTDKAGRYGGEEFLLVLPDCAADEARQMAEQILQLFRMLHFSADSVKFSCTFSAGVASTSEGHFSSAEQLLATADEALYQAKRSGRNKVC